MISHYFGGTRACVTLRQKRGEGGVSLRLANGQINPGNAGRWPLQAGECLGRSLSICAPSKTFQRPMCKCKVRDMACQSAGRDALTCAAQHAKSVQTTGSKQNNDTPTVNMACARDCPDVAKRFFANARLLCSTVALKRGGATFRPKLPKCYFLYLMC